MPSAKPLSKEMILRAIRHTKSNRSAARYLGISYTHYKGWAKLFNDEETGINLFKSHLNQCGKGIPKYLPNRRKEPNVKHIIEKGYGWESFSIDKIKIRLITEGYLEDKCNKCGFCERRVTDYKIPLLLNFNDNNKSNFKLENLELLCYNCYFLYITDPFTKNELRHIETNADPIEKAFEWDLDPDVLENMKALGLI